jgi:flagella basal body P-ring formation protein FlgA
MEVHVRGTELAVSSVARVDGPDASLVARVAAVDLGYAPAPGYSRLLFGATIQEILARRVPDVVVRVVGERACRVWPETVELAAREILDVARTELTRRFGERDASYEEAGTLPRVVVPAGAGGVQLRARLERNELATGTVSVPIEVIVDGELYRTVWTSWRAQVWDTLPVAARAVRAGETLRPEMFERQRVDLGRVGYKKPLNVTQLAGVVAAHDLEPGQIVTDRDVHRPALVTLGDSLFLSVRKGNIEARVAAIALEAGAVGDRIRIRTVSSSHELLASVVSRDLAKIDLGR